MLLSTTNPVLSTVKKTRKEPLHSDSTHGLIKGESNINRASAGFTHC